MIDCTRLKKVELESRFKGLTLNWRIVEYLQGCEENQMFLFECVYLFCTTYSI